MEEKMAKKSKRGQSWCLREQKRSGSLVAATAETIKKLAE